MFFPLSKKSTTYCIRLRDVARILNPGVLVCCKGGPFTVGVALLSVGVVATQTDAGKDFMNSLMQTDAMDHPYTSAAVRMCV